jgi:hypothetical protein
MIRYLAAALFLASPALAQEQCAPRAAVLDDFEKRHGEKPFLMLVADGGVILEVLRSPNGGWTIFVLRPDGMLCLVMAGGDSRVARSS